MFHEEKILNPNLSNMRPDSRRGNNKYASLNVQPNRKGCTNKGFLVETL